MNKTQAEKILQINKITMANRCSLTDVLNVKLVAIADFLLSDEKPNRDFKRGYLYGIIDKTSADRETKKYCRGYIIDGCQQYWIREFFHEALMCVEAMLVVNGTEGNSYNDVIASPSQVEKFIKEFSAEFFQPVFYF